MSKLRPQQKIFLTFFSLILIGSLILVLPVSVRGNKSYLDALFTSTSAVTITGLQTVSIKDTYTLFGKIVIVILMQLGGLSITTISVFILTIIGAKITYRDRDLVKENININSREGIVKTIVRIIKITVIIELIGVIYFFFLFLNNNYDIINSLGHAIFHTVSAYNNSGLSIIDNDSLMFFSNDYFFNIGSIILIILGSIGTLVIYDLSKFKRWSKLKHHTKIVVKMTFLLLFISSLLFYLLEPDATILNALFHAATIRTAGFYTYNYNNAKNITLLLTIIFMYIGGAPASNSGGVKVTTIYTLFKTSKAKLLNKTPISYKRKISNEFYEKSHLIITLSLLILTIATLIIVYIEPAEGFLNILFEVFSAFSNTGLSLDLTSNLHYISKLTLILLMFVGRVGVITFFITFLKQQIHHESIAYLDIDYLI